MSRSPLEDVTERAQAALFAELGAYPKTPERARLGKRARRLSALRRAWQAREKVRTSLLNPERLALLPRVEAVAPLGKDWPLSLSDEPRARFTVSGASPADHTWRRWPWEARNALIPLPCGLGAVFVEDLGQPRSVAYLVPAHLCAAVAAILELRPVPVGLEDMTT